MASNTSRTYHTLEIIYPTTVRVIVENVGTNNIDLPEDVTDVSVRGPSRSLISISRLGIYGQIPNPNGNGFTEYRRIVTGPNSHYYTDGKKKYAPGELIGMYMFSRWAIHRPRGISHVTVAAVLPTASASLYYDMSLSDTAIPTGRLKDINMMVRITNRDSFSIKIDRVVLMTDRMAPTGTQIDAPEVILSSFDPPITIYASSILHLRTYNDHLITNDVSVGSTMHQYITTITPRDLEFFLPAPVAVHYSGTSFMVGTGYFDGQKITMERTIRGRAVGVEIPSRGYTLEEAYPEETPLSTAARLSRANTNR